MRLAHLVQSFPSLSETFILGQITGLIDLGHEVDIYAWGAGRHREVHEAVTRYGLLARTRYLQPPPRLVSRFARAPGRVLATGAWREPRRVLRSLDVGRHGKLAAGLALFYGSTGFLGAGRYDLVHCQFGTLADRTLALRKTGAALGKLAISFRGADLTRGRRSEGYGPAFEAADLILPVSRDFAERLERLGCPASKIHVVRSGIPVERFPFRARSRAADETTRILIIGRLVEKKGVAYAIEAVARLKENGRDVRLSVVGDGPLREELESLVESLRVGDAVHMTGSRTREEVAELLAESHLLVAPSVTASDGDQEGIPNTLKEAMAAGLPVVSTLHSGIPELVEHERSGFLVPERDSGALAERLGWLVDHPEAWPEMGRAGRTRVEEEYDIPGLSVRLAELYRSVVHS